MIDAWETYTAARWERRQSYWAVRVDLPPASIFPWVPFA